MDAELVKLVKSSFDRIDAQDGGWEQFTRRFYDVLFSLRADTHEVFANVEGGVHDRLLRGFREVVVSLAEGKSVMADLRGLGVAHRKFELEAAQYLAVGVAMSLALVETYEGGDWPPDLEHAWRVVYSKMASVMMRS